MAPVPPPLRIATMTLADLDLVLDWAAAEGWNPGLDDARAFLAADPDGFLIGRLDDLPVAAIAAVRHSDAFGFLGLYITRDGWRGRGLGARLWQAGLAHLGDRTVGLDGVLAQQQNYGRAGFRASHRTIRHQGRVAPAPAPDVVPVRPEHLPALLALDRAASGVDRRAYLSAWFADSPHRRTLVLDRGGRIDGYGTIRACRSGAKVGPLHAADPHDATRLLAALATLSPPTEALFLDIPEPNYAALALARDLGFAQVFETARMFRGPPPAIDNAATFAEVTLELG